MATRKNSETTNANEPAIAGLEELNTPVLCEIEDGNIILSHPTDAQFSEIVQKHHFTYDKKSEKWTRDGTMVSPTPEDGICAVGKDLLNHRFGVQFPNGILMKRAKKEKYIPDADRYVSTTGGYRFVVNFPQDDEMAEELLNQFNTNHTNTKYKDPVLEDGQWRYELYGKDWEEIKDLVENHNFYIGEKAQERYNKNSTREEYFEECRKKHEDMLTKALVRFNGKIPLEAKMAEYVNEADNKSRLMKRALYEYLINHGLIEPDIDSEVYYRKKGERI